MLTWMPLIFMGLIAVVLVLMLRFMPSFKMKPQEIEPGSSDSIAWEDVAGVEEAKDELREVVEFLRDPKRFRNLGARVPEGHPPARSAGHGQDAAGQGGGARVQREVLRPVGLLVRGDVRRAGRRAHPAPVQGGAQERPRDHLHRRARRGRRHARQRHLGREGPDAQPAAGGARRLRHRRRRGGRGRLQPAREARHGAAAAGALRPPDLRHPARPQGPPRDPARAHARQAAGGGRGPRGGGAPDQRPGRRRPGQHLQRGSDLRGPRAPREDPHHGLPGRARARDRRACSRAG